MENDNILLEQVNEELMFLRSAIKHGAGERSELVAKMARGLVDDVTDIDAAVAIVMENITPKDKPKGLATGARHGSIDMNAVNQHTYNANANNQEWLRANKSQIMQAMINGEIK